MPLPLPPPSLIKCDDQTADWLHGELTSVIAGHPQAATTYQFYEELDTWLGPWGQQGYPIGYGKFYNVAFSSNAKLMANASAKEWVWKTTIRLQEALRDYVVGRVRSGSPRISEIELRQAAFDSHPLAYDQGGLALLAMVAPELMPIITTIPGREFMPNSANFRSTVRQVFVTVDRIAPQMAGMVLATMAGPAHTGILRRAADLDNRGFWSEMRLAQELADLKDAIENGKLDHVPVLDEIIAKMNSREFPDQHYARQAAAVVQAARVRRQSLVQNVNQLLQQSPTLRTNVQKAYPYLLRSAGP